MMHSVQPADISIESNINIINKSTLYFFISCLASIILILLYNSITCISTTQLQLHSRIHRTYCPLPVVIDNLQQFHYCTAELPYAIYSGYGIYKGAVNDTIHKVRLTAHLAYNAMRTVKQCLVTFHSIKIATYLIHFDARGYANLQKLPCYLPFW